MRFFRKKENTRFGSEDPFNLKISIWIHMSNTDEMLSEIARCRIRIHIHTKYTNKHYSLPS